MTALSQSGLSVVLVAALLATQTGCAEHPARPAKWPSFPPSPASIKTLGRTGVEVAWGTQEPQIVVRAGCGPSSKGDLLAQA